MRLSGLEAGEFEGCLAAATRQQVSALGVRGRDVDVQRAQRPPTGIPDFVRVAPLNEQERPGPQRIVLTSDNDRTRAGENVQPLVTAAVTVLWAALRLSSGQHHFRRLGMLVAQSHTKSLPEPEFLSSHSS